MPYMQWILNSENIEFEKQELKRKMKFHGVKNIEINKILQAGAELCQDQQSLS